MTPLRIVHHTYLERRGGATAVARTLWRCADTFQQSATLCFEVRQTPDADVLPPHVLSCFTDEACKAMEQADVIHMHASGNWDAQLKRLQECSSRLVLTTHDASLITGGCPYPLTCTEFHNGCTDPCPQHFPDVRRVWETKRSVLQELRPTLVSPSAWLARIYRSALPGISVHVIPNGVEVPEQLISREQAKQRLGLQPQAKTVLFVAHGGQQAGFKGGDRIEAIFHALQQRDAGIHAFVLGGFDHKESGGIHSLPYVEGEVLSLMYRVADVFVYPTRSDNHPLVVLEAMGHGTPVVAYAVGGIPEQMKDREEGMLVEPGKEAKLVAAVLSLLTPPSKAHALGERARARCRNVFSHLQMAKQYDSLYRRL
ncbi:glycosyltransferase [Desulfovibrio inopinatus]|uniref:glycosyltransferase n=1 Tax=Desulfovibrio inopinatus TaxID=102109 RepID=UPI000404A2D7|nr:glycosyltransferase [Desulfovibrio inopinatus]